MLLREKQASFIDHLEELRKRILISFFTVLFFSSICFFFARRILTYIIKWTNIGNAYFFSPTEALMVNIKVALFVGFFISFPLILYQVWAFIGPGLTRREQRVSLPFMFSGIFLFLVGCIFAVFILIPVGMKFFFSFGSENIMPLMNISKILEFIIWCIIGCGILFQLPLLFFFLIKLGLVQAPTLARHRSEVIIGVLIVAAIITPTGDIFTLLLISIPLVLLIELSILLAKITTQKINKTL
ncbi:MAG: twin-arginine translocase subunit TatC [bacterium]